MSKSAIILYADHTHRVIKDRIDESDFDREVKKLKKKSLSMNGTKTANTNHQIASGWKHTALGILPADWKVLKLKEVARIGSGTTPSTSVKGYWGGDVPWLPTGKVNDRIILSADTFITEKAVQEKSIKLLPKDSIVIAMIGQGQTRGKSAILKISAWVNQNFAFLIPGLETDSSFLFYLLEHNYERIRYEGSRGGSQSSLNTGMVKALRFAFPSLIEQQKIAAIFGACDLAIDTTQKLIDQIKLRNKGLARQLLAGKKRLKGIRGEWKKVKFADVAERIKRKNDELNDTVITISAQRGFVLQEDFFSKRVASEILSNYYLMHRGEFSYNKSYSNGYPMGAFKRLDNYEKAVVTTLYICFSLKDMVDSDFMTYFFEAGLLVPELMEIAQEGGRAHGLLNISLSDFFGMQLKLPDKKEQIEIAKVLNTATCELQNLESQLCQLKEQKKGLMQKLLTGEVRVKA